MVSHCLWQGTVRHGCTRHQSVGQAICQQIKLAGTEPRISFCQLTKWPLFCQLGLRTIYDALQIHKMTLLLECRDPGCNTHCVNWHRRLSRAYISCWGCPGVRTDDIHGLTQEQVVHVVDAVLAAPIQVLHQLQGSVDHMLERVPARTQGIFRFYLASTSATATSAAPQKCSQKPVGLCLAKGRACEQGWVPSKMYSL